MQWNVIVLTQGQVLANLKAMDSDWFSQNFIGRSSKVHLLLFCNLMVM